MSINIDKAFVQQFKDNLRHRSQQKGSKLMSTVEVEKVNGKAYYFEILEPASASIRTDRHGVTPINDIGHTRRKVTMKDLHWGEMIDDPDKVRMLINPEGAYAKAGARELGRQIDDLILEAATGNAVEVDAADAESNVAFSTNNTVDEDFGTVDSNLSVVKVIEAHRLLAKNEVDMDEDLFLVLNASALHALLNDEKATSGDYHTSRALVSGELNTYMGFNIIRTERLRGTADGTDVDPVQCLAYARTGMGLAMGKDINVRIGEDPSYRFSTRVYATLTCGAVRIEDEKVIKIECVQS